MAERKTCGLCPSDCDLSALLCPRGSVWLEDAKKTDQTQPKEEKEN